MDAQVASPSPVEQLLNLAAGRVITQSVAVAAELKVADHLQDGERSAADIARLAGTHDRSTYRLLRALASVGLLDERPGEMFALTPVADLLRSDARLSLADAVKFFGMDWQNAAWNKLLHSVTTGTSAFSEVNGAAFFDWLPRHPREAESFHACMTSLSKVDAEAVTLAYDFAGVARIIDVGGGQGQLLATILSANPAATGAVYDLPEVGGEAQRNLAAAGLGQRYEVMAGDFFAWVPAGFDAYLLKYILHDWDDDACVKILERCAAGMTPGGRILVIEQVLPPAGQPSLAKLIDLEMLVMTEGGGERSEAEYAALLGRAGLTPARTLRTQAPVSIIEAVKRA